MNFFFVFFFFFSYKSVFDLRLCVCVNLMKRGRIFFLFSEKEILGDSSFFSLSLLQKKQKKQEAKRRSQKKKKKKKRKRHERNENL